MIENIKKGDKIDASFLNTIVDSLNVIIPDYPDKYEYVDLGITNSSGQKILFAKCNIGAENEYDVGLYFQWGDTIGYTGDDAAAHSTWSTCPFNNGSSSYDSTYFATVSDTVCPNGVLSLNNDAAHAHMRGAWRMPTASELKLLISNTNYEWTSINGIDGAKFINKSDSTKYIFIPQSGLYTNGELCTNTFWGVIAALWTSTISTSYYYQDEGARFLKASSSSAAVYNDTPYYGCGGRPQGLPIRGIMIQ